MFSFLRHLWVFPLFVLFAGYIPPETPALVETDPKPLVRKSSLVLPADPDDFRYIRVAIVSGAGSIEIGSKQAFEVFDAEGRLLLMGPSLEPSLMWVREGVEIQIGNHPIPTDFIRMQGVEFKVGKYTYRDSVLVWREPDGTLLVVNELSLEDYLKGVLPWEANPNWSMEALKAQAVASRTFALFRMLENRNERFDVSSGIMSQVYKGKTIEKAATNDAVEFTRGQILTYETKIFPAFFHSTSGGATTSVESLWNMMPHPSLSGVITEFSQNSEHFRWTGKFRLDEIREVLRQKGYLLPDIVRISAADLDLSGRARTMIFHSSQGDVSVNANDFRIWIGPGKFKSTKIASIEFKGNQVEIRGFGWGHGVGMCQHSAKNLGQLGYTYRQILNFFYAESSLIQYFPDPQTQGFWQPTTN